MSCVSWSKKKIFYHRYIGFLFGLIELAFGAPDNLDHIVECSSSGTSTMLSSEDLVEATLDEENSHQSSSDPLSPSAVDFSDEEGESDMSSDDLN